MSLAKHDPSFTFSGNQVAPSEIDRVEHYYIINPNTDIAWFGTLGGTQTQAIALGVINGFADYPRNVRLSGTCASGSVKGGDLVVNGKDQFGNAISETISITPIVDAGTTMGTKIFSKVTSGTFTFGTGDPGAGTIKLGLGTIGTTTLFGLPTKIASTADVKNITFSHTGVGTTAAGTFVFGGTPSSAAVVAGHYIKLPQTLLLGTTFIDVSYKSSYVPTGDEKIINL